MIQAQKKCFQDEKHFNKWNQEKQRLHTKGRQPQVNDGEIWWCGIGENIGVEINGKGESFTRPILVFKKLSRFGFIGIPLTSQPHVGSWYAHFRFQGRDEYAVFAQMRNISIRRLHRKMGRADDTDMQTVKIALRQFLFGE